MLRLFQSTMIANGESEQQSLTISIAAEIRLHPSISVINSLDKSLGVSLTG
jgi:hypothetical protein